MLKRFAVVVTICSAALLCGCDGSSSPGRLDVVGVGTISSSDRRNVDGSYADVERFTARADGWIEVAMLRTGSDDSVDDPYLVVWRGAADDYTDETFVASDDDSGGDNNAYLLFYGVQGGLYAVLLTTYGPDDFGEYIYRIREVPDAAATTAPAVTRVDKPYADPFAKVSQ